MLVQTVTAVVVGLVALVSGSLAPSTSPAYPGDFPDPSVTLVGTTYWAYSTGSGGRNLQVMSSHDLRAWSVPTDPLPVLPSWARPGFTWAPSVSVRGSTFIMYYTVRDAASGRQCISTATASGPAGPFTDTTSSALLCQLDHGGSIDPSFFVDAGGTSYLLWKSDDNAFGHVTNLWAQALGPDGRSLVGTRALLLRQSQAWQAPSIEGPSMVLAGGTYNLFYGAAAWDTAQAGIGYATCTSPLGPCVNQSRREPWMASHGAAVGPSGPDVFSAADGSTRLAYHAWTGGVGYANGGVRSLWIDHLTFPSGRPTVG